MLAAATAAAAAVAAAASSSSAAAGSAAGTFASRYAPRREFGVGGGRNHLLATPPMGFM